MDQAKDQLLFIDNNPAAVFIGKANLNGTYEVWLRLKYKVFGFAMDPHFSRRKLYWTSPKANLIADGSLYWVSIDATTPIAYSLTSVIGQANLIDPMGIAVHMYEQRLYWLDKTSSLTLTHSVLRSCNLDGTAFNQTYVLRRAGNHSIISTNLTDIVIDYAHNNTAVIIDTARPAAIIGVNLNFPHYNDSLLQRDQMSNLYPTRVIASTFQVSMSTPRYLAIDEWLNHVIWSDKSLSAVRFAKDAIDAITDDTVGGIYTSKTQDHFDIDLSYPVGLAFNYALGPATFGDHLECFGHGQCLGLAGNWKCKCQKGYIGDCQMRSCPVGPAWFHEPAINDTAHDVLMECSNIGVCDRSTGECLCKIGYEGAACERMSCPANNGKTCSGRGRLHTFIQMHY